MYEPDKLNILETLDEIKLIISTADFPCSKEDILKCAKVAKAPKGIIKILEKLPESSRKFNNADEVINYLLAV